ncbi:hypothetical protein, partial [Pseudomonas oryzihabitans]|uniref:hypothetical protein n=1 Tax=Pseudomonas oryzihabitans TaxID=47885 RepID=UPI001C92E643
WVPATSTAGTPDRLAAAEPTFSTESVDCCQWLFQVWVASECRGNPGNCRKALGSRLLAF